ncbi:MAG: tRNA lysidine(34) synthetase TilS [Amoebophilaceae bacterium]|nr:tRNA lysidine(34) synthetase TilS [Amoebophilaceae bacterium]
MLLPPFLSFLNKHQLIKDPSQPTLLAVSGGVDSVVLCHLFQQAHLPFAIAHCNFNLRGATTAAEAHFVDELSKSYGVPCYSRTFATKAFAKTHKLSIQMAARRLRYDFFYQLIADHSLGQIATAHHWDDTIETLLLNFIKGTGIMGLQGIPPIYNKTIRPLLFARKKEIIAFARAAGLEWKEDGSNASNDYQRNFLRNQVIPLLQTINPNFEETTRVTLEKLRDTATIFQQEIEKIKKEVLSFKEGIGYVAIKKIANHPSVVTIVTELLGNYGFSFEQVKKMTAPQMTPGKVFYATDYTLYVDREVWMMVKKEEVDRPKDQPGNLTADIPALTHWGNQTFYLQCYNKEDYQIRHAKHVAALNYNRLTFPLTIRPWQAGDYLHPLGMKGRKNVSDLLIDLKIPLAIKNKVTVITSQEAIVWVVGYCIDDRFKVTAETTKIVEITAYVIH